MELTALVIDDEPFARTLLRGLLEAQGVAVTDEAGNVADAIRLVEDTRPDVVFLDIQMPGMTGLQMADVLMRMPSPPLVIFVTGYSEYAVSAFDKDALDYLLKPPSAERVAIALARARERLRDADARKDMVRASETAASAEEHKMLRLPIRDDYSVKLIRFEEIVYAEARDKRVLVHTVQGEHRTYYTLKQLDTILPREDFCRIHDSFIVNLGLVEELLFLGSHSYEVRLPDNTRLPVSRGRYPDLQRHFGLG
jgi:DNA-binding LytR/AlgR family response regulator